MEEFPFSSFHPRTNMQEQDQLHYLSLLLKLVDIVNETLDLVNRLNLTMTLIFNVFWSPFRMNIGAEFMELVHEKIKFILRQMRVEDEFDHEVYFIQSTLLYHCFEINPETWFH